MAQDSTAIIVESAEFVRQGLTGLPIVADGRNCRVRHLPSTEAGKRGKVLIEIDLDENVGPSGSGANVMIGTMGRNVSTRFGTIGVNFWRSAENDEERAALVKQTERAAEVAELQAKLKAARGGK